MPTNFEKYLAGEPLNEELAALKSGVLPDFIRVPGAGAAWMAPPDPTDPEKPLTQAERAALRELRQGPGWAVLQKLLERATIQHINAATAASEDDPLAKSAEIAALWHTVKVWKQLCWRLRVMVDVELMEQRMEATHGERIEDDTAKQGA